MAGYVRLGDVDTWYDEQGAGEALVLLHPGGVDARAFGPNIDGLAGRFRLFTGLRRGRLSPGRLGAGGRGLGPGPAGEPTLIARDLRQATCRTLVMVGDDDEVTLEHAVALYRGLPVAELAVVPGTSHGLLVEKPDLCNRIILDFLTTESVPTMAPIRRARGE